MTIKWSVKNRRKLKSKRFDTEEDKIKYGEANMKVRTETKKAEERGNQDYCDNIQRGYERNNTKKKTLKVMRAYRSE